MNMRLNLKMSHAPKATGLSVSIVAETFGRTLTLTATGTAGATLSLTALTLDDVDVLLDATGTGPWVYDVASDSAAQTVAWEVTASNGVDPDATATGSLAIAADILAPDAFISDDWTLVNNPSAGGNELTLTLDSLPAANGSALTELQWRVDSGSGFGAAQTLAGGTATGARTITVLAETPATIEIRAVNAIGAGDWSAPKTATPTSTAAATPPAQVAQPTVAGGVGTLVVNFASDTDDGGSDILLYRAEIQIKGTSFFDEPAYAIKTLSMVAGLPYAEYDGASYYTNFTSTPGSSTVAETEGNANEYAVFFDVELPATLSAPITILDVYQRQHIRILTTGQVEVVADNSLNATVIDGIADCDIRGGRHRVGITFNGVGPTVDVTVDGVAQSFVSDPVVTVGDIVFDFDRKPWVLLAERLNSTTWTNIVPSTVKVYQIGLWHSNHAGAGTADINWVAVDAENLDVSTIETPTLYLGDDFSVTTLDAAYDGTLTFSLIGTAPDVTSGAAPTPPLSITFTDVPAGEWKARVQAENIEGAGEFSISSTLDEVTAAAPTEGDVTIAQNDWAEIDLFDLYPAAGDVRYTLQAGSVPAGMTFMAHAGLIHGVPSGAGTSALTIRRTVNEVSVTDFPLDVVVTAGAGGAATPLAKTGAIGFGRLATGGRGETVYRVTNLSANPATSGSLPWAIAQAKVAGGGYILVEAEGPLELTAPISLDAPNMTIDFRRAPGLGFWFTQAGVWVMADNIILRHPRSYPGSNFSGQTTQSRDCYEIMARTDGSLLEDVYVERPDAMFSIDEILSVYPWRPGSTAQDITIEGALIADAMHRNLHLDEGVGGFDPHSKGPLINSTASRVTFYGGLFASLDDRSPRSLGNQIEYISTVIANYNSDAITVGGGFNAFVNNFYMYGPAIGSSIESHKLAQGIGNINFTGIHDEGSFTGKWTLAGGFVTAGIESRWRYGNIGPDRTLFLNDTDNPGNFTASMSYAAAVSYSDAFLSLADRVGALNASGERHPFAQRVINYVTAAVPFQTAEGYHGIGNFQNAIPDEFRAIGGQIVGAADQVTVTLPVANAALPPVVDRPWTSVEVTILDAYTMEIYDGLPRSPLTLPRTSKQWATDGISQAGSLAGGAVVFNSVPNGFYVARVTYFSGAVPVRLYTGRPVEVT